MFNHFSLWYGKHPVTGALITTVGTVAFILGLASLLTWGIGFLG